jgi:hypothetical protein
MRFFMLEKLVRGSCLAVALAVCAGAAPAVAQNGASAVYTIDAAASEIHWRVYKAGAFARFGHNHVIAIAAPAGRIELAATPGASRVELTFAVADLVIDNPELRGRYGDDFASVPSEDDIAGTRRNMLTEPVLNGEVFPTIRVVGANLSGFGQDQRIDLAIDMLGRTVNVTVPVDVTVSADAIDVTGAFRLTHEDLGMMPFSVMMGALQVGNDIDFTIDIHAVPERL